ncbi:unnamed protein product [Cochlearia groenlandica]
MSQGMMEMYIVPAQATIITVLVSVLKKQNETRTNQTEKDNKTLKKPTKIIPCPRCKSMETNVLLLQQLQRKPTSPFLQSLSKILDFWWNHEKCPCRSRTTQEQEQLFFFSLPPRHHLRTKRSGP